MNQQTVSVSNHACAFRVAALKKAITLWVGLRFVQILLMLISWQLCVSAILWMWMCLASWHIRHSLLLFILNVFCCAYLHIQVSQLRWQITSMSVMGAQFLWPSAISHWDKTCFFCPRESFDTWDRIPWLLYCQPFGLFVQHDPVFNFLGTVKLEKIISLLIKLYNWDRSEGKKIKHKKPKAKEKVHCTCKMILKICWRHHWMSVVQGTNSSLPETSTQIFHHIEDINECNQ